MPYNAIHILYHGLIFLHRGFEFTHNNKHKTSGLCSRGPVSQLLARIEPEARLHAAQVQRATVHEGLALARHAHLLPLLLQLVYQVHLVESRPLRIRREPVPGKEFVVVLNPVQIHV